MPDPLKLAPPVLGLPCPYDRCWSNSTSEHMEIHWINWVPHILPFKVTQGHRN